MHGADRNLLFGIIAHQMDFVTRDQLVAGMHAWVLNKGKSLGAILVELGSLTEPRRGLIDALVEEHIQQHGGDPAASLRAMPAAGSLRDFLEPITDEEVQQTLTHLPAAPRDAEDSTVVHPPGEAAETASWQGDLLTLTSHFRVLRSHKGGGQGEVYLAKDQTLDRRVALKQIQEEKANDEQTRARFVFEAEVTGGLDHPFIVPIHGLGFDRDHRPFYAMRFIEGQTLRDASLAFHRGLKQARPTGAERVAFRDLLNRFIQVCQAIDYAHERGVIHRDLKPSNIMLGMHGETLVVDWGLAKVVGREVPEGDVTGEPTLRPSSGSDVQPTATGAVAGTLDYMPPEQAEGRVHDLDRRSDVYALGATLYFVLTGRSPIGPGDPEARIRQIVTGSIVPPREAPVAAQVAHKLEVARPLEAICRKAMNPRPEGRYATAGDLARDLQGYLAGEPVTAYREHFGERAARWSRKHRTLVTTAGALLVAGLVGVSGFAAMLRDKNRELVASNAEITRQRKRAEFREKQAIDAVRRFGDAVTENPALKNNPAFETLRKTLLKEPMTFFKTLREQLQADQDTRPEAMALLASAAFDHGRLIAEIGERQVAIRLYEQACEIGERLVREHPTVIAFAQDLAKTHNNLGHLRSISNPLPETRDLAGARRSYEAALEIYQRLASEHPADPGYALELARAHGNLGPLLQTTGDIPGAQRVYEAALVISDRLVREHPSVPGYASLLATTQTNLGNFLYQTDDLAGSRRALEAACEIYERLVREHSAVEEYASGLATAQFNLGFLLANIRDWASARRAYETSLNLLNRLAREHTSVIDYGSRKAGVYDKLGLLLETTQDAAGARKAYEAAVEIYERLVREHPAVPEHMSALAKEHNTLGSLLLAGGDGVAARKAFESARATVEQLAHEHPTIPEHASDMGATLNNLALLELEPGRFGVASDLLKEALTWQRKAIAANPQNPLYRQFLANHLKNFETAHAGLGDDSGAADARRQLAELQASDPRFHDLDARMAEIAGGEPTKDNDERLTLAQRAYDTKRYTLAARLFAEALESDPKLAADRQTQHAYNAACSAALAASSQGKDEPPLDDDARAKLRAQALTWLQAELKTWSELMVSKPDQTATVAKTLDWWQQDSDLASLRGPAIDALPESERAPWRALWGEVETLIQKAQGGQGKRAEDAPAELPEDVFAK